MGTQVICIAAGSSTVETKAYEQDQKILEALTGHNWKATKVKNIQQGDSQKSTKEHLCMVHFEPDRIPFACLIVRLVCISYS